MNRELDLWKGDFGNEYTDRNEITDENLAQRVAMLAEVLKTPSSNPVLDSIKVLEVGANVGINLKAMSMVMHRKHTLHALEPNDKALNKLKENIPSVNIVQGTASDIAAPTSFFDFVFTSGVLIHINDEDLKRAMLEIYRVSSKWIFCAEYFSAEPIKKQYRGIEDFIYLRDYGSLWIDKFPLRCLGYGFCWKRITGLDNITWWLFEKVN